ncbi:MAG: hypothetical protein J07HX5_00192 [halophilic archaeon J07HX5]|jgi:Predicted ATPase, RNase L inhibitor (RLI) homolog|nr:MAG: hypothetical protein J07HX5_00192 [halophilic archaeon J07HX5]
MGSTLYRLPASQDGRITGTLGPNAIGKTALVRILARELAPNSGYTNETPSWDRVIGSYRSTKPYNYLIPVRDGAVQVAREPQYVDRMPG